MESSSSNANGVEFTKKRLLVRVSPRYVRLRQGSEIRYSLKLTRPISKVQWWPCVAKPGPPLEPL